MKETAFWLELLEKRAFSQVRALLEEESPVDVADLLEQLEAPQRLLLFRLMDKGQGAQVFSYMEPERQQELVQSMSEQEITGILDQLHTDDAVDFLGELPANLVKRVLKAADPQARRLINQFLQYPDGSAGSLMTTEFIELEQQDTAAEALRAVRRQCADKESISTCFVTDGQRRLEGVIRLRQILTAPDGAVIGQMMQTHPLAVGTHDDQQQVASLFKRYDLISLPVVDGEGRLVGIITVDDVVDVIEQEDSEDFYKMAAVTPDEGAYLKTGILALAKNRLLWLLVLMISSTITGGIISRYNELLGSVVVLASYIPMLMDTGGNAGSQSATMVIRGLALGQIQPRDLPRILRKEAGVGLATGAVLTAVNFLRILLMDGVGPQVALVVCLSLYATVVLANFCGGMLPVVAQRCRLDPAMMASPLISTIVDAMSLTIFFSLASCILQLG